MQLIVSAGLIAAVVLWGLVSPATLDRIFSALLADITRSFGWFYLWVVLGLVVLAFFLAVSRYGDLKLGDEDEEPEFSVGAWFAMLFAAGMGIGLVFWGVAEPVSHYVKPPPGIVPGTPEAAGVAMRYAFFHWGFHPWAIYGIVGLAISFFTFRRKALPLVSSATEALPWPFVRRLSPAFNVLAVVATAFGVAASLGMGATQINSGLHTAFGLPIGPLVQSLVIVVTTAVFITSAVSGVDRGVKWLSIGNLVLAGLLALVVLCLGPTVAIVDTLTNTLGAYISEFVRMSLRMSPFRENSWVGDWTIFYWAWWLAWSPFVGLFIARVSRGRTVRQFLVGTVLAPSLVGFVWFAIFGGTALNMEIFHGVPLAEAVTANVSTTMFVMFQAMPMGLVLSGVATLLVFVFFVTSGDSATLVLGTMSTGGNPNPPNRVKVVWGVLVAAIALSLLLAGGLKAIQTATIVFALPFSVVLVLMAVSVTLAIREDWEAEQKRERALRRKMREFVRD
ncbi:BCCT family transporter [Variovorax sp. UMC13]|uniref:BCCT family transporter n=1 Tax=Variovorax sp. UMC13 TaxID=1862326 RepID=UPI0015FFC81C|nr:BCCT family transporter [Variovorax sp. UMC13]MBB1604709.1 glycine/betaine ABC transporter permease [Variovorax sp. UMC13]